MLRVILLYTIILLATGCSTSTKEHQIPIPPNNTPIIENNITTPTIYLAHSDTEYKRLGLDRYTIASWEDALRTSGDSGSFEWWYCDYIFSDGTAVVVVFYTKRMFDTYGLSMPSVSINIIYPDGTSVNDSYSLPLGSEINASREKASIKIGSSYLEDMNGSYRLRYSHNGIELNATMVSTLSSWRPETGYAYFGGNRGDYFAWLVAQPSSLATASLHTPLHNSTHIGTGYHDHNWGNAPMHKNIDNWYWGRILIGEYRLVFADIVPQDGDNGEYLPILYISKGDKILENLHDTVISKYNITLNSTTQKPYANKISIITKDEYNSTITIDIERVSDIGFYDMSNLPYESGTYPTYLKTLNSITLTTIESNGSKTLHNGMGVVEQMSFDMEVKGTTEP